ncbi:hypothetical protein JQ557_21945 [Bradyrhizobium sp. U87765 SZCCT0131]|uniref:hypothetical protein n=1 Tax=unclassified Bradyrhizobium TaxID=2631580 RepID=UPI001BACA15A|nr:MULTISPECIES: hypothetical protein [unclassified Bradyrhizobium]MBR1220679.1 hypothetical protein [Bradyrhizobium sp. U87765 SZCCT0131]MBR1262867.1 hypothetical protein [Bradyrhizobium sp. U87765 SZCCT0134]MBR1307251.1 hypothetical protein [Bradyrhizobium sp. U87765 SZCCT0110]MBR1322862.1 hypothetical protein [Bradyrhizobium sp. U87765 SZCCT0109]MBR1346205.1 hypothetical protein [Bradyrhizobium sp. U87765 SZCCT0048]
MRRILALIVLIAWFGGPARADDIQTCGNQGTDNRPNWCARPNGAGGLVQGKSQCRKISDTQYEYTHCSGSTTVYTGNSQCCTQSTECPGAFYVADCVR